MLAVSVKWHFTRQARWSGRSASGCILDHWIKQMSELPFSRSYLNMALTSSKRTGTCISRLLHDPNSLAVWSGSISHPFACHCIWCWSYRKWRGLIKVCAPLVAFPVQNQSVCARVGPAVTCTIALHSVHFLNQEQISTQITSSSTIWLHDSWNIQRRWNIKLLRNHKDVPNTE
jgi:hypothetical protein